MGGGLMQLVAYGAQDIYLTGNPQITFFKVVYRRHTNFSMEAVAQTFSGNQAAGGRVTSTITRNGDLISKMYYEFSPQALLVTGGGAVASNIGHALFNEITLEIGGQEIDKHYGHWLTVWNELTEPNPQGIGPITNGVANRGGEEPNGIGGAGATRYQLMSYNHGVSAGVITALGGVSVTDLNTAPISATIPFQFWFNRNPGLALPLIALQYHEVKINITFSNANAIGANRAFGPDPNGQLWVDYIYLDTDERRRFAQQSHEYLIEQLQFAQTPAVANSELNFNHPVKELIWTGVPIATAVATPTSLTNGGRAAVITDTFQLKLNGHDRFAPRKLRYFTRAQIYQHHTGFGAVSVADSIGVYSFALKPEEHQPSGTCNFSRIDNSLLVQGNAIPIALNVYAVNYNVLRIMSGMGGLAYSN
jgi:hypothetical protein